jgi:ribosomal protein L32
MVYASVGLLKANGCWWCGNQNREVSPFRREDDMSLVTCNECGHQLADRPGTVCPGCGAPTPTGGKKVTGHHVVTMSIAVLGVATFVAAPSPYGPFVGGLIMIIGLIAALA